MYMALTENQAEEIRKLGISVIEWKNCVRKIVNATVYIIKKTANKIAQICKKIKEKFRYPVPNRYKFVKFLGISGYDKRNTRTLTRHTWLARSNC